MLILVARSVASVVTDLGVLAHAAIRPGPYSVNGVTAVAEDLLRPPANPGCQIERRNGAHGRPPPLVIPVTNA